MNDRHPTPIDAAMLTTQMVENVIALPSKPQPEYDPRTLAAVDAVLVARIQKTSFREAAKTLNNAREAIRRELGGTR